MPTDGPDPTRTPRPRDGGDRAMRYAVIAFAIVEAVAILALLLSMRRR